MWETGRNYTLLRDEGSWNDDTGVYEDNYTEREEPVFGILQILKPYELERLPEGVKLSQAKYRFLTRERINIRSNDYDNDNVKRPDRIKYGGIDSDVITLQAIAMKPAIPPWENFDETEIGDSAIYIEYYFADAKELRT